jgi:hypothetical protein
MKLMIFMGPPQRGHSKGSTCQMRLISAAQGRRAVYWLSIELPDGKTGWIRAADAGSI